MLSHRGPVTNSSWCQLQYSSMSNIALEILWTSTLAFLQPFPSHGVRNPRDLGDTPNQKYTPISRPMIWAHKTLELFFQTDCLSLLGPPPPVLSPRDELHSWVPFCSHITRNWVCGLKCPLSCTTPHGTGQWNLEWGQKGVVYSLGARTSSSCTTTFPVSSNS